MMTECSVVVSYVIGFVNVVPFDVTFDACIILYGSSIDELVEAGDIELRDDPNELSELWLCVGDMLFWYSSTI